MTTLNLVLTNEINDILEERQREKEKLEAEGSDHDQQDEDAIGEEGAEGVEGGDSKLAGTGNDT